MEIDMDIQLIKKELEDIKQDIIKAKDDLDEYKNQIKIIERNSKIVGWVFTGVILILSTLLIITIIKEA